MKQRNFLVMNQKPGKIIKNSIPPLKRTVVPKTTNLPKTSAPIGVSKVKQSQIPPKPKPSTTKTNTNPVSQPKIPIIKKDANINFDIRRPKPQKLQVGNLERTSKIILYL
jgi:hypothetical protein